MRRPTPSCLAILGLALTASGCVTTGNEPLDIRGDPIPRGTRLKGERYDDLELLASARSLIVVPFGLDRAESSGAGGRLLKNAAVMVSEEIVRVCRDAGRLEAVGLGRGDEPVDLAIYGRMVRYVPPTKSTDFFFGGVHRVEFTGEIYERATGRLIGAFHASQPNPNREWYADEEGDLKRMSREAGQRIGAVLARRIGR